MPHNLLIVDYGLGHPGSVHDAYAFQGTRIASQPATLIPHDHWIWADTAYPTETWCVVPFKKPRGGGLSQNQNRYNRYVSKVCLLVLVFATQGDTDIYKRFVCAWNMPSQP
jgi:hypothetical protein